MNAAARGDIKTVTSMLQQGEDPNSYDHVHLSAVHAAAANDFSDVVELLHKSGANIDALDKNVSNYLQFCCMVNVAYSCRCCIPA